MKASCETQPSPKGESDHAVYDFVALDRVYGRKPAKAKPSLEAAYRGKVAGNFARHGQANGVVLDIGDFAHTRPDGRRRLRLKVGDAAEADGDARRLADDAGWAVDATQVNGVAVREH